MSTKRKITVSVIVVGVIIAAVAGLWGYRHCTTPEYKARRLWAKLQGELAAAQPGPPSTLPGFLRWLPRRQQRDPYRVAERLAWELVAMGPPAVPILLAAMETEGQDAAFAAAACLAEIGSPEAVDPLMALLDGNDERLRYTAFIALRGNIDMPRVRDRLIACLSDPNEQVAYEAAVFLGRTRNPEGIAVAAELLEHEDPQKRRIGTLTLGYARDPRAIKPLVEVLDATDPHNTRWIAVNLLAKFDDPVAVEALRRVAESDPDANRRSRAKRLLKDKAASTQPSR